MSPPTEIVSADPRLWPLLAALATNAIAHLGEVIPSFAAEGFQSADFGLRSQNIAIAFYASIAHRVASAILTLVRLDQGEEAIGLRRELGEAQWSLAYYQQFIDEARKLVASRNTNLLTFSQRVSKTGLSQTLLNDAQVARLSRAAAHEQARYPDIIIRTNKRVGHWREPNIKTMLKALHDAWDADPEAKHTVKAVDEMLEEKKRGSPEARADSQYAGANEVASQWLHNTFILSDRYIDWVPIPKLRPLSNSMRESPNMFLEMVAGSTLAVANGIYRQMGRPNPPRLESFAFASHWFRQILKADAIDESPAPQRD